MATVAVIGSDALVRGYQLAGVAVMVAETSEEVREAWRRMPPEVNVVILTAAAAAADPGRVTAAWPMTAVMPG